MAIYLKNEKPEHRKLELKLRNLGYGGNHKGKTWFDVFFNGAKYILNDGNTVEQLRANLERIRDKKQQVLQHEEFIKTRINEELNRDKKEISKKVLTPQQISLLNEAVAADIINKPNFHNHWFGELKQTGWNGNLSDFLKLLVGK